MIDVLDKSQGENQKSFIFNTFLPFMR